MPSSGPKKQLVNQNQQKVLSHNASKENLQNDPNYY